MNKTPAYKYILCLILSLALCLAFCACGGTEAAEPSETPAGSHVSGGFEEGPNYGVKPNFYSVISSHMNVTLIVSLFF